MTRQVPGQHVVIPPPSLMARSFFFFLVLQEELCLSPEDLNGDFSRTCLSLKLHRASGEVLHGGRPEVVVNKFRLSRKQRTRQRQARAAWPRLY